MHRTRNGRRTVQWSCDPCLSFLVYFRSACGTHISHLALTCCHLGRVVTTIDGAYTCEKRPQGAMLISHTHTHTSRRLIAVSLCLYNSAIPPRSRPLAVCVCAHQRRCSVDHIAALFSNCQLLSIFSNSSKLLPCQKKKPTANRRLVRVAPTTILRLIVHV